MKPVQLCQLFVSQTGEYMLTQVNDKLEDLKAGNPLLPPDPNSAGTLEVVPVHDDMDRQVERDWHP